MNYYVQYYTALHCLLLSKYIKITNMHLVLDSYKHKKPNDGIKEYNVETRRQKRSFFGTDQFLIGVIEKKKH